MRRCRVMLWNNRGHRWQYNKEHKHCVLGKATCPHTRTHTPPHPRPRSRASTHDRVHARTLTYAQKYPIHNASLQYRCFHEHTPMLCHITLSVLSFELQHVMHRATILSKRGKVMTIILSPSPCNFRIFKPRFPYTNIKITFPGSCFLVQSWMLISANCFMAQPLPAVENCLPDKESHSYQGNPNFYSCPWRDYKRNWGRGKWLTECHLCLNFKDESSSFGTATLCGNY